MVYFAFLLAFTSSTYFASSILGRLLASRASFSPLPSADLELAGAARSKPSHPVVAFVKRAWSRWRNMEDVVLRHVERLLQRAEDQRVTWLQGIGWAVCGGSLAGMCLVFTKAVVKLLGLHDHPVSPPISALDLFKLMCSSCTSLRSSPSSSSSLPRFCRSSASTEPSNAPIQSWLCPYFTPDTPSSGELHSAKRDA